jgi:hypothetical protein
MAAMRVFVVAHCPPRPGLKSCSAAALHQRDHPRLLMMKSSSHHFHIHALISGNG